MTAKEMFEKLGYKCSCKNYKIIYSSSYNNTIIVIDEIIKTIKISQIDIDYAQTFNINELQAINQQVKELGWDKE